MRVIYRDSTGGSLRGNIQGWHRGVTFGEFFKFKHTHRAVPHHCFAVGQFCSMGGNRWVIGGKLMKITWNGIE